jgi:hypothetical protein
MGHDRACGVEYDGVAHWAFGAGQHRTRRRRVGCRVTAHQLIEISACEAESGGIKL